MSKISLIIITGLPCTGKTTLGKKMAEELHLPLVAKDEIKELLFDCLGHGDIKWSEKISKVAYDILFHIIESNLKVKKSVIVESNFSPRLSNKRFLDLKNRYNFTPVQVRCTTDGEILLARFKERADSGDRHLGHVDSAIVKELEPFLLKGAIEALDIGSKIFDIDTSDFNKVNYDRLFSDIKTVANIG